MKIIRIELKNRIECYKYAYFHCTVLCTFN